MSHFNKRHYEAVALAIQEAAKFSNSAEMVSGVYRAATELAGTFQRDNSQFNRERFMAACYPGANVKLRTRYDASPMNFIAACDAADRKAGA